MKKRTLALAALAAAAYWKYHDSLGHEPPGDEELLCYFDNLFQMLGLPGLSSWLEEDWVENDGLRLHLDLFLSDPSDPALVFVPGTSVYALFYAEFMHKMRSLGFNVIGLDPRGHGRSEGSRGSYTVEELLSDARAATDYAIARFGERVAIAGSSQGGIVSFYAAASDERLKAAVCHNIAELGRPEAAGITRSPALMSVMTRLVPLAAALLPELPVPVWTYLDLKAEPTRFGLTAWDFFKRDPLVVKNLALRSLASLATAPLPKAVEAITVPVMVLQAECDEMFTVDYTRRIYDRLTCDKEFLLVTGASHLVLTNDVDTVVPEVAAWLNEQLNR